MARTPRFAPVVPYSICVYNSRMTGKPHGVWKVTYSSGKSYCPPSHRAMLALFRQKSQSKTPMTIYKRSMQGGWAFVVSLDFTEYCICGKNFNNSYNNEYFRAQNLPFFQINEQGLVAILTSPFLCQECFYKIEWENNRWVPKYWRWRFEANTN